jgi:hypothetical protein
MARPTGRGFLKPWWIVGLGLLAACLLALFGPFGQLQCSTRPAPSNWAQQLPRPPPLGGHAGAIVHCINAGGYAMVGVP